MKKKTPRSHNEPLGSLDHKEINRTDSGFLLGSYYKNIYLKGHRFLLCGEREEKRSKRERILKMYLWSEFINKAGMGLCAQYGAEIPYWEGGEKKLI